MNTAQAIVNWKEQKGKLKQNFEILTNIDLMFEDAKNEYVKALYEKSNTKINSK